MKKFRIKIGWMAALVSILTLALFNGPFYSHAISQVEPGFNGKLILAGIGIILLVGNYLAAYILMFLGRIVGKILVAFFYFIANTAAFFFIKNFDVLIDDTMMGNFYNTRFSEASGFWSGTALLYLIIFALIPTVLILATRINYGTLKAFLKRLGISLGVIAAVAFGNISNWTWIDKNSTILGSLILPWSYIVNTFRYFNEEKERNREEIKLPDASFSNDEKAAMVLVIGESSRSDHYSLLGYGRNTNPRLSEIPGVRAFEAEASATYTIGGVKAILEHTPTSKLYEILPNYLSRCGADVSWRTTNWGEPPVHIEKYFTADSLAAMYPGTDRNHDCILTAGLREAISESPCNKVLIILHTSTSHGPAYNTRYPSEFEVFTPVCNTVEMSKCPKDQLMNAYDNTIVYTDWLLSDVISNLKGLEDWKTGMIFVSDHGESLGENGLYMHGVPMAIAPEEQIEIPFIVWTSGGLALKNTGDLGQHHVFHSVLHFLGIDSEVYDEEMNIFE